MVSAVNVLFLLCYTNLVWPFKNNLYYAPVSHELNRGNRASESGVNKAGEIRRLLTRKRYVFARPYYFA